jgi:hypothetical protein
MEHLLYNCEHYTIPFWREVSKILTLLCTSLHGQDIARIHLTPTEIVFNKPHPSLRLYVKEEKAQKAILMTIQELKRSIIFRRMNVRENQRNRPVPPIRIHAHILSVCKKVEALYVYKGLMTHKIAIQTMKQMQNQTNHLILT